MVTHELSASFTLLDNQGDGSFVNVGERPMSGGPRSRPWTPERGPEPWVRMVEAEKLDAAPLLATGPVDATPAAIEEFLES